MGEGCKARLTVHSLIVALPALPVHHNKLFDTGLVQCSGDR